MFGREVIEVSTFRSLSRNDEDDHSQSDGGLILRDNVYGTIEEDALRRDFTVNALYYNIANFALYDFVDSLKDIERKQLRLIGDPEQRYREDPVRMLRAARFAAKLGFDLAPSTEKPIRPLATLLYQVPAARLFDEMLKLFLSGYAEAALAALQRYSLFEVLFPETGKRLHDSPLRESWQKLIEQAARNTDARIAEGKPVTPAFICAVLLWPAVQARLEKHLLHGMPYAPALAKAAGQALNEQCHVTSIPKRFSTMMREIWELQERLDKRQGRRAEALVAHPRFRAAYDFLLLREQCGELPTGLGDWWTQYQQADEHDREQLVRNLGQKAAPGKRRRRRPRRGAKKNDD
jgi:poly(A) polymerase